MYRGWFISTTDEPEKFKAVKGKQVIVGNIEQIKREIDRRTLEELRKEI